MTDARKNAWQECSPHRVRGSSTRPRVHYGLLSPGSSCSAALRPYSGLPASGLSDDARGFRSGHSVRLGLPHVDFHDDEDNTTFDLEIAILPDKHRLTYESELLLGQYYKDIIAAIGAVQ